MTIQVDKGLKLLKIQWKRLITYCNILKDNNIKNNKLLIYLIKRFVLTVSTEFSTYIS